MRYTKIIFLDEENTFWSPLAEVMLKKKLNGDGPPDIRIISRGNVVLFPEPVNQKAAEIACNNQMSLTDHVAEQLSNDDFSESTLVLALDNDSKLKAYSKYTEASNVFTLREYIGEQGDIKFHPGRAVSEYTDAYNILDRTLGLLADKIKQKNK